MNIVEAIFLIVTILIFVSLGIMILHTHRYKDKSGFPDSRDRGEE